MYKLYWDLGTLAIAPHLTLEACEAEYTLEKISLDDEDNERPEFLAINPAGTIPVLIHEQLTLTESAAITLYVAHRHPDRGLLPEAGTVDHAVMLRWFMFAVNTIQPAGRRMYYPERFSIDESHVDGIQKRAETNFADAWKTINDQALGDDGPYVLRERFSVADIYLLMFFAWHEDPDTLKARCPRVARWLEACLERPAVRRVLEQHDAL